MSPIAKTLGVSRTSLYATPHERGEQARHGDDELLALIKPIVEEKPTFGYRRVTARLNKLGVSVNHKRIYRIMRREKLLLQRYAPRPERAHEGRIVTLKSDLRWCTDAFEIRCWNGDRVHVVFSLDCCDREAISWVAADKHLVAADVQDLMAQSIEARFGGTQTPHPIEWLSDNGPQFTAYDTRLFGAQSGLIVRNTPSYSPESNGMAEAFVKTFKRDFVYLADVRDAATVMKQLPNWFEEYNEENPHKGLKMLTPRDFRRANSQ